MATSTATVANKLQTTKLIKDSGRRRLLSGTEWPILHILEGNEARGYTVSVEVCRGSCDTETRRHYKRLSNARAHFDQLIGDLV